MDADNVTICYQAIQRVYRNAVVQRVRERFAQCFGPNAVDKVKALFKKEWDEIAAAAKQSRATGELSCPLRDDFDVLGVNHFYNLFEAHFDALFPAHIDQPEKEKSLAKQAILGWARTIKNLRDPLSHPAEVDFGVDDARQMLYCARNILDAMQLFQEADEIITMYRSLDEMPEEELLVVRLPPADEVVTHFVGRKSEMLHLRRWFEDRRSPRWALAGDGGKGKSAIAYSFAREITQTSDPHIDAIIWLSAKRRRFVQGQSTPVDRPDFRDRNSAVDVLLAAYGESGLETRPADEKETELFDFLNELPALLVIDDIDTLENEGLEAVQLFQDIPIRTKSKLLITSRRVLFGLEPCTTTVSGLNESDANAFISSRCELMGIEPTAVMKHAASIRDVTDSSPLYIEDLLRLTLAGLNVDQAIGLWQRRRGAAAREYAIRREFEQLPGDAKEVLFVLSLMDRPCTFNELRAALSWHEDRVLEAQQSLRQMFLMPNVSQHDKGEVRLSLNNNTRILVHKVFSTALNFDRVRRRVQGVIGQLETSAQEDEAVESKLGIMRAQVSRVIRDGEDPGPLADTALQQLKSLEEQYPGRSDISGTIGWLLKRLGRITDAREAFRHAAELHSSDRQMYWHWSEMEAKEHEWKEAIRVADMGREEFPSDRNLLYVLGYAQARAGCEAAEVSDDKHAKQLLNKARHNLGAFVDNANTFTSFVQKCRAWRALVLAADALEDGKVVSEYLQGWVRAVPSDRDLETEYRRMRTRYPEYVMPLEDAMGIE